MIDRIMSRTEVATFIGQQCRADGKPVGSTTIARYHKRGLPRMKLAGRVTYRESQVLRWIQREGAR